MIKGRPYSSLQYEDILKEQLLIAYLSKGAITITETSNMPINDRKILLHTLQQAEEAKRKHMEELKEKQKYTKLRNKK